MRVADLDRDMSSVFPQGMDVDAEFLYDRMRDATYAALRLGQGGTVLDSAAGIGFDAQKLAERGISTTNVEPSRSMTELMPIVAERQDWKDWGDRIQTARAWSEALPFRARSFDAAFCKGSIDHLADPAGAIGELARVTRIGGRVVVAVANFDSLSTRLLRLIDRLPWRRRRGERTQYHVPADHFTRFDMKLIRSQFSRHAHVEEVTGVSALWGLPAWNRLTQRLPEHRALMLMRAADRFARAFPSLADVIVIAGPPRLQSRSTDS